MANEKNLIPGNKRTMENKKMLGRKGGLKSVEVRRQRKQMKEDMLMLLSLPLKNEKLLYQLEQLGIEKNEINNQTAMIVSLFQEALKGNTKAIEIFRDTIGEKPQDNLLINGEINNPFKGLTTDELRKIVNDK